MKRIYRRGYGTHMGASWYNNPKVTELYNKASTITDLEERVKLYQKATAYCFAGCFSYLGWASKLS